MKPPLNCRPGDQALIVRSPDYNPVMMGLVVKCLALSDPPHTKKDFSGRMWRIDRDLVWRFGDGSLVITPHIPDTFLRAVRPGEILPSLTQPKPTPPPGQFCIGENETEAGLRIEAEDPEALAVYLQLKIFELPRNADGGMSMLRAILYEMARQSEGSA